MCVGNMNNCCTLHNLTIFYAKLHFLGYMKPLRLTVVHVICHVLVYESFHWINRNVFDLAKLAKYIEFGLIKFPVTQLLIHKICMIKKTSVRSIEILPPKHLSIHRGLKFVLY